MDSLSRLDSPVSDLSPDTEPLEPGTDPHAEAASHEAEPLLADQLEAHPTASASWWGVASRARDAAGESWESARELFEQPLHDLGTALEAGGTLLEMEKQAQKRNLYIGVAAVSAGLDAAGVASAGSWETEAKREVADSNQRLDRGFDSLSTTLQKPRLQREATKLQLVKTWEVTKATGVDAARAANATSARLVDSAVEKLRIGELQVGESQSIKVGGKVSVEVGAEGQASLNVSRSEEGYEIKAGLSGGAVAAMKLGGRLGSLAGELGHAEGGSSAGMALSFETRTAAGAERVSASLIRLGATGSGLGLNAPSPRELAALMESVKAIELSGKGKAEIAAGLGLASGPAAVGLRADAGVAVEQGIELEFERGRLAAIKVTDKVGIEGKAQAGVGRALHGHEAKKGFESAASFDRSALGGEVEVTHRFPLPEEGLEALHDPRAMAAILQGATHSIELKLESTRGGEFGLRPLEGGSRSWKLEGQPGKALDSKALAAAVRGDSGALESAGAMKLHEEREPLREERWNPNFGFGVAGVEIEGAVEWVRKTR